jgi:uncharacterized membrane protein YhaH (DUF805 family)
MSDLIAHLTARVERSVRFAMHPRHRFTLAELADPRGRCNRRGFLVVAVGLLACQLLLGALLAITGFGLTGTESMFVNAPLFWLGLSACVQRLHDLNKRAWIIPAAVACWLVVASVVTLVVLVLGDYYTGRDVLADGSFGYMIMFTLIMVPAFGGLLWLHATPGTSAPNRFGAVPGRNGFAAAPAKIAAPRVVTSATAPSPDMSGALMA